MAKIVDPDGLAQTTDVVINTSGKTTYSFLKVFTAILLSLVFLASSVNKVSASPNLLYSTYFGGDGNDYIQDITTDQLGNTYITGSTASPNFPLKNSIQSTIGGGYDIFVAKFSQNGDLIFSTYMGGSSDDNANGISVGNDGSIYITGTTYSMNFPIQNAFQNTIGGSRDVFLVKLSNNGSSIIYSTFLGGSSEDVGSHIALDASDNIYITGKTSSTNFPILNAFQTTFGGNGDGFIAKFLNNGSLVYSSYLGGNASDSGNGIAADSSGNAYITGTTSSTNFPTLAAFDSSLDDGIDTSKSDAFVTKISNNGTLEYSTYLGGYGWNSGEIGNGVAVDSLGNVYVTGQTSSTNFPITNAFQSNLKGSSDIFVTKFTSDGSSLIYSTYFGGTCDASTGSGNEVGWNIKLGNSGKIYLTGMSVCTNYPLLDPIQNTRLGSYDVVLTELSSDGSGLVFSTYLGGGIQGGVTGTEIGKGVAIDEFGNIYVAGITTSSNFPVLNAYQSTFGGYEGGSDGFLTKIGNNQPPIADAGFDTTGLEGQQVTLDGSDSTDPDGTSDIVSYSWDFGDGNTGSGIMTDHTYSDNGVYVITLTISDTANHTSSDTTQILVNNVAPVVGLIMPIPQVLPGISVSTNANFSDTGTLDTHTTTFNWGDGVTTQGEIVESDGSGNASGSHSYSLPGVYMITLTVTDKDGASSSNTTSVTILTPIQATENLTDLVQTYNLQQGIENSLDTKLDAAIDTLNDLNSNNDAAAINSLQAFINAVEAQRGNKITNEQADILIQKAQTIINRLSNY